MFTLVKVARRQLGSQEYAMMREAKRYYRRQLFASHWLWACLCVLVLKDALAFSDRSPIRPFCHVSGRRDARHFPVIRRLVPIDLRVQRDDNDKADDGSMFDPSSNNNSSNNIDTEETQWLLTERFQKADLLEIRRDAILVSCFVLSRFLVYDVLTSTKVTPGWVVQDFIWLSGTFSSAVVLIMYWSIAGLLSRTFEASRTYGPMQVLVNVALCCPIWLATEHLFGFGPANIGGETLSEAIGTGFLGLAAFMTLARALTTDWER